MTGAILLPTAYFPPVSYFAYILNHETLYIEQMETYPKQNYRNRWEIMTSGGRQNLIVPVNKANGNQPLTPPIRQKKPGLLHCNTDILAMLLKVIGIERQINFSSDFEKHPASKTDLRNRFKPGRKHSDWVFPDYPQMFSHLHGFMPDLSILDLIFNLGPEAKQYLERLGK